MPAVLWQSRRLPGAARRRRSEVMHRNRQPVVLGAQMAPLLIILASCIGPVATGTTIAPAAQAQAPASAPRPAPPPRPVPTPPVLAVDSAVASQGGLIKGSVSPGASLTLAGADVRVAGDGSFLIAFDRDAVAEAVLVATNPAGIVERRIMVAPFSWRIENVNARMTGGAATTAEFRARRQGETAAIAAARATTVSSEGWRQQFIWPVRGRISGQFGAQRVYRGEPGSFHSGTDIAAPTGTPFVAPADGVVTLAASTPFTLEGHLLIVDHGMGLSSAFLHNSRLDVQVGDVVRQGQQLGLVGATGRASGPHMHWGMRWGAARIDPARVAGPMAAR